jgi:hypothetical protein
MLLDEIGGKSGFSQNQVKHPAAPSVRSWPAAMAEDVGVVATDLLQGVGEFRQAVEILVVVDAPGLIELPAAFAKIRQRARSGTGVAPRCRAVDSPCFVPWHES